VRFERFGEKRNVAVAPPFSSCIQGKKECLNRNYKEKRQRTETTTTEEEGYDVREREESGFRGGTSERMKGKLEVPRSRRS